MYINTANENVHLIITFTAGGGSQGCETFELFNTSITTRAWVFHTHSLTEAACSQEDAPYSIGITLPGHPDDDAARHNAEQGRAHP